MTPSPSETTGLLDTNILILRAALDAVHLPDQMAISTITLAELSAGVHLVVGDDLAARQERARRTEVLQRVENEFDPLPFDADAARVFGRLSGSLLDHGRRPRRRVADLMIAAVAVASGLRLFTTNPGDFAGLQDHLIVVPVPRPTNP